MSITAEEYRRIVANASNKKSKYSAKKVTTSDGITFDSKKERRYYAHLQMLLKAGLISDLRLQVSYLLAPAQYIKSHVNNKDYCVRRELHYVADFVYNDQEGKQHVVDVKGFRTAEYKHKAILMKRIHGITIEEIDNV